MSNIYEIAEKTKLSPSTVARALSGRGYCSPNTRKLVEKVAKELNYVPSQAAKTLRNNITNKILLCIPDIYNPFYFRMIKGASDICEKHNYRIILQSTDHSFQKEIQIVDQMQERIADGLIMVSFNFNQPLIERIKKCAVPVAITNFYKDVSSDSNFDCVYVDHTKAVYLATSNLIAAGHRHILFIGGNADEQTGMERLEGYRKALEDHSLPFESDYAISANFDRETAKKSFCDFLDCAKPVSAVVCANDLMGVGVIDACHSRNLSIPKDISVITLDNTDFCTCVYPNLSSVDMKQEEIGGLAVEMLLERIRGERRSKKSTVIQPELISRNSVKINKNI